VQKKHPWILVLLTSALLGAVVWALSPLIAGSSEPWDAPNHYYPVALALAGLVAGTIGPRIRWAFFAGAVLGQLLFGLLFLEVGPLALVGLGIMCFYSLIFLAAAILATYLRSWMAPGRSS